MKRTLSDRLQKAAAVSTGIYVALMSCLFILGFHNNYIDIQDFKFRLFVSLTTVYLIAEAAVWLLCVCTGGRAVLKFFRSRFPSKARVIFPLLFAAAILLGWCFSEWPGEAAFGSAGRQIGAVPLLLCILVYFSVTAGYRPYRFPVIVFLASTAAEFILGILNLWGIDPLRMYVNLIDEQHSFFIGTVGNKNVTSSYLCLILPVIVFLATRAKTHAERAALFALIVTGFYYGIGVSSDSFLLGMGAMFAVLLWQCMSDTGRMTFVYRTFGLFLAAMIAVFISVRIGPGSPFFLALPASGLIGRMVRPDCLLITGGLFAVFVLIGEACRKKGSAFLRKARNILFTVLAVIILVTVMTVITVNLLPAGASASLPRFLQRLVLSDDFGSNRGYIWKRTAEAFALLPPVKKLIGVGPDCFYQYMVPLYGNEMTILYGAPFADAHNEFLQFLLTTGILGVTGYFGTLLSGLFGKNRVREPSPYFLVIAAFMAQGLVNNPQIVTTPLLFIVLSICFGNDGLLINHST